MALRYLFVGLALTALACSSDRTAPEGNASGTAVSATASTVGSELVAVSASADVVSGASHYASSSAELSSAEALAPPLVGDRTVDGAALRKKHVARLRDDKSPVTLVAGDDPLVLGKSLCEAVVPKRPPATPVLIKPNLCGFDAMKKQGTDNGVTGRTTQPEFVRGIVQCLKARGHTRVTIAEGCAIPHQQFLELAEMSGYAAMAREEGVPLVALDDDGVFDVEGEQPGKPLTISGMETTTVPTLLLPKAIADHLERGMWISAPKIKTHRYSVTSGAIKGMQGIVMRSEGKPAHTQKWRMHKEVLDYIKTKETAEDRVALVRSIEVFSDRIMDVLEVAAPDVVLAEGAPAMGGDGFQVLTPLPKGVAIGGTNPVAVDKVAAEYLGLWDSAKLANGLRGYRTSPLIERAAKRYALDLGSWPVTGNGAPLLKETRPVHFVSIAPFAVR